VGDKASGTTERSATTKARERLGQEKKPGMVKPEGREGGTPRTRACWIARTSRAGGGGGGKDGKGEEGILKTGKTPVNLFKGTGKKVPASTPACRGGMAPQSQRPGGIRKLQKKTGRNFPEKENPWSFKALCRKKRDVDRDEHQRKQ